MRDTPGMEEVDRVEHVFASGLWWDARVFEDLDGMTRGELLVEYWHEYDSRGWEHESGAKRWGRRRLIKEATMLRAERLADVSEMAAESSRSELVAMAREAGLPHSRRTKRELAEALFPFY